MAKKSRAEKAGELQAKAIIETVHLMYQDHSAENFYNGLLNGLLPELKRRGMYFQNLLDFMKKKPDEGG